MFCGDQLLINLITKQCSGDEFEIGYKILEAVADKGSCRGGNYQARCIEPVSRTEKITNRDGYNVECLKKRRLTKFQTRLSMNNFVACSRH